MKAFAGELLAGMGTTWPGAKSLAFIFLPILAGTILALLLVVLGPIAVPIVFSTLFIFPWLMQDAFRPFIWLIITWPILVLYVRVPLPAGIPDLSYDRVLILFLVSIVMIEALLSKRRLMKITAMDILMILYVAAQIGSRIHVIWFGGVGNTDLVGFLNFILMPVMMYWVAKNLVVSKEHLKWLLFGLVIAAIIVCPTGLYEQAIGARVFRTSISLGGSEETYQWQDAQGRLRAAGALANPAIYGAILGIGSLAAMACLPLVKRRSIRIALLAIIGILLYGVLASYTRSAWLSVLVVLFAAQFFLDGIWKRTLPLIMLGLTLLILLWNMLPDTSNLVERALNTKTVIQRLDLTHIGWERFLQKPILGWGSGALNHFDLMGAGNISHNTYLTFLVDGGLVLFLSFFLVIGYLLVRSLRLYSITAKSGWERNTLVVMIGSIMIYLLLGLALELRYFGYFAALFWICAGVIDRLGIMGDAQGLADG